MDKLELHQFVLAEVVCGLSHMPYATFGAHEALQEIHRKKFEGAQFLHMSENHEFVCFGCVFGGVFGGFTCAARKIVHQIEFLK